MRTLEPGDKVWIHKKIGTASPGLHRVVMLGKMPSILTEDSDGKRWWCFNDKLTFLPPWIDEPSPLGEIQRVFEGMHSDPPVS